LEHRDRHRQQPFAGNAPGTAHLQPLYARDWPGLGWILPWDRQLSTFELFDLGLELGLDGFHLDDGVLENLDASFLTEVGAAAAEKGLYLEYNLSLDLGNFGIGIQHDLTAGLETARAMGADVVKVGMEIPRPRPRAGSRFHPKVRPYLEETAQRLQRAAPRAESYEIRLALENHCDSFSEEILWVLEQVDHPFIGACIDTVNAWHVAEDPMKAIENLAPVAFTNHFRDDRVEFCRDGFRVRGVAVGDGDIDIQAAYNLLKDQAPSNRINIETEMGFSLEDKDTALQLELETVKRSIHYCREVLGIGKEE